MSRLSMRSFAPVVAISALLWLAPFFALAQQTGPDDDLHVAIWSSLLSDPRTANIPPDEMQRLVDSLAQEAQKQNLTPADILYRPERQQFAAASALPATDDSCDAAITQVFCSFNSAFGFSGNDVTTPVSLLATSTLLILLIRRMTKMHNEHAADVSAAAPPWA